MSNQPLASSILGDAVSREQGRAVATRPDDEPVATGPAKPFAALTSSDLSGEVRLRLKRRGYTWS